MAKGVPILGKDPLGKAKYANVTESGDLRVQLSGNKASLGANVWHNAVNLYLGATFNFISSPGSPLAAGSNILALDITGYGRLNSARFQTHDAAQNSIFLKVLLDGREMVGPGLREPYRMYQSLGEPGKIQFATLFKYDTSKNQYGIYYDFHELGPFGNSCVVLVENGSSQAQRAYLNVLYAVGSSKRYGFMIDPGVGVSSKDIHSEIISRYGLPEDGVTVVLQPEGDGRLLVIYDRANCSGLSSFVSETFGAIPSE